MIVYNPVLLCSACVPYHTLAEHVAVVLSSWDRSDGVVESCSSAAKAMLVSAGRPLLVSLLLYLDTKWPRQWDAETLFLDDDTDIGIVVRPKCFRAVLMDQVINVKPPAVDVTSVSPPPAVNVHKQGCNGHCTAMIVIVKVHML